MFGNVAGIVTGIVIMAYFSKKVNILKLTDLLLYYEIEKVSQ